MKALDALFGGLYSKNSADNWTKSDILACVINALEDPCISQNQRARIKLDTDYGFCFLGNQAQIAQVILNIIENALHATAGQNNGLIEIWAHENSLFIKDNGYGISPRNLPKIFEEFFSTKKSSGQGLAFCQHVMSNHNGTIQCESEENCFTQFELNFPKRS